MGILGRFYGRKNREALSSKKVTSTVAKRVMKTIVPRFSEERGALVPFRSVRPSKDSSSRQIIPSSAKRMLEHSAASTGTFRFPTDEKVAVSSLTEANIRDEVMQLLESTSTGTSSVLVLANALGQSMSCRESHASGAEDGEYGIIAALKGRTAPINSNFRRRNKDKEEIRRRYEWTEAMNRLEKQPSSRDERISSWEEAKASLEKVLIFPPDEEKIAQTSGVETDPIAAKYMKKMAAEFDVISEKHADLGSIGGRDGYRTVVSQADQLQKDIDSDEDLKALVHRVKKDLTFNATLRNQQELYDKLRQSEAVKQLEERMKLKEAKERAAALMRPLTDEEREIVEEAIYGHGPGDEIIAQFGADSVLRQSMRTLQPGQWLNDEVIHYFLVMLANRDEEMCKGDPKRKRSHFFKSFFITALLNEGNATCDGQYEYRHVKRWSKKVPGKDIFALDKIVFPVNMGNMHWICAVVFMTEKRIRVYDSMGSSGRRYLEALFHYLKDEHMDKKKKPLPDEDEWELVGTTRDTPQQRNGKWV